MITDEKIIAVADQLRAAVRCQIRSGGGVPPTIFLVAREHPVTGSPIDHTKPIIPLVQPHGMHKEQFVKMAIAVALASRARAAIIVMDAWHVRLNHAPNLPREEALKLMQSIGSPSTHEDREECVNVIVEFDDGPVTRTNQAYRRDDGRIIFDPVETMQSTLAERAGLFSILNERVPPPHVMESCRNISAYMLKGIDWVDADFAPIQPGDEEAQEAACG